MMTTKQLMQKCESYYGLQYSRGMGDVVIQYLDTVRDDFKSYLFAETVKAHSVSYKSLPDVNIFEDAYELARAEFYMDHPPPERLYLPAPGELASPEEIAEFEAWFRTQTWRSREFEKVKDWKREDRLC